MKYYHVAATEDVASILRAGLECRVGNNSELTEDWTPCVYLCDKASVPYWSILCGKSEVFEVEVQEEDAQAGVFRDYGTWVELKLPVPIPSSRCKYIHRLETVDNNAMCDICTNHLRRLVKMVHNMIGLYESGNVEQLQNAEDVFSNKQFELLRRLDFSALSVYSYARCDPEFDLVADTVLLKSYTSCLYEEFRNRLSKFVLDTFGYMVVRNSDKVIFARGDFNLSVTAAIVKQNSRESLCKHLGWGVLFCMCKMHRIPVEGKTKDEMIIALKDVIG